jgi:hypothetical protein
MQRFVSSGKAMSSVESAEDPVATTGAWLLGMLTERLVELNVLSVTGWVLSSSSSHRKPTATRGMPF